MGRYRLLATAVIGVVLAVVLLPAPAAYAHTVLVGSEPAAGATLAESPGIARLHFSQDVVGERSSIRLVDSSGSTLAGTSPVGGDPRGLAIQLPRLARGSYGLVWEAVAARDEHVASGTVVFSIGAASAAPPGTTVSGTEDLVRRWAGLIALAMVVGPLAVALLVLGPAWSRARRSLLRVAAAGCVAAIAVGVADLLVEAFGEPGLGLTVALGTRWGALWIAHTALLIVLLAVMPRLLRGWSWAAGVLVAGLAAVEALSSHAAAVPSGRVAALVAIAAHALAGLVWLGAVPALVIALWPRERRTDLIRAVRGRFALLAAASVGLVLVTGLYSAGVEVASVDDLVSTAYGRLLLVKTALMTGMGALGFAATIRMHDRRPALSRLTLVEVSAGAALLLAVGALTVQAPPLGPSGTAQAATERTASGARDDLRVTVSATPNQPGLNWFTVLAESTRRPEPYPIEDIALRVGGSHGDTLLPLRPLVAGRYVTTYRVVEAGPLHVVAVVHRGGHEEQVRVGWTVEAAGAAAAIPPGHGLAPYADAVALVLLEGAVVAGAWLLIRRQRRRRMAVPDNAAEISDELVSGGSR